MVANKEDRKKRVLSGVHFMPGNYALVEGALSAGCDFFGGYPITPANEISERMSQRLPEVGGKFLQGEDELCSIYSVVSASLAGAKAMIATASAGYNYLQEGIGYACATEAPCVIVDVNRCRGENYATQSDVMQLRWGASGDHEMIVFAPSTVQELYDYTIEAFNVAEEYRCPVVIMSEATIALSRERLVIPAEKDIKIVNRRYTDAATGDYVPFKGRENGVPDFAPMGKGYNTLYTLNYHDEMGGIEWDADGYERLYKRITGKISDNRDKICKTESFYMDDAEIAIIAYGTEVRPALDAVERAREENIKVGLLKLATVWPVPETQISELAKQVKTVLAVEMNIGKYANEIERVCAGRCQVVRVTKNRGIIHTPQEIYSAIKEVI